MMAAESSQASSQKENQDFVWNQRIMSSKLNIKIGDDEFFHPAHMQTESYICASI